MSENKNKNLPTTSLTGNIAGFRETENSIIVNIAVNRTVANGVKETEFLPMFLPKDNCTFTSIVEDGKSNIDALFYKDQKLNKGSWISVEAPFSIGKPTEYNGNVNPKITILAPKKIVVNTPETKIIPSNNMKIQGFVNKITPKENDGELQGVNVSVLVKNKEGGDLFINLYIKAKDDKKNIITGVEKDSEGKISKIQTSFGSGELKAKDMFISLDVKNFTAFTAAQKPGKNGEYAQNIAMFYSEGDKIEFKPVLEKNKNKEKEITEQKTERNSEPKKEVKVEVEQQKPEVKNTPSMDGYNF